MSNCPFSSMTLYIYTSVDIPLIKLNCCTTSNKGNSKFFIRKHVMNRFHLNAQLHWWLMSASGDGFYRKKSMSVITGDSTLHKCIFVRPPKGLKTLTSLTALQT